MKTVWIYIDTDALPRDVDHLQVFVSEEAPNDGSMRMIWKALPSNIQCRGGDPDYGSYNLDHAQRLIIEPPVEVLGVVPAAPVGRHAVADLVLQRADAAFPSAAVLIAHRKHAIPHIVKRRYCGA
jgi:hypothetical protein